jgi:hypothetical protein
LNVEADLSAVPRGSPDLGEIALEVPELARGLSARRNQQQREERDRARDQCEFHRSP